MRIEIYLTNDNSVWTAEVSNLYTDGQLLCIVDHCEVKTWFPLSNINSIQEVPDDQE